MSRAKYAHVLVLLMYALVKSFELPTPDSKKYEINRFCVPTHFGANLLTFAKIPSPQANLLTFAKIPPPQGYVLAHTYAAVHVLVPVARAVADAEDGPLGARDRSTLSGHPVEPGAESCNLETMCAHVVKGEHYSDTECSLICIFIYFLVVSLPQTPQRPPGPTRAA